ncbi:discoidin domain-containing protein [Mucilaginibacter lacusdianchii]|uniref:discoidin domain-containing protein n=1 Tax=Mucilaginibacter lacusdianchii TaxID=2684211 RepID=UPI001E32029B|nr:discoidin domain-containing protein [Mucilaginibacter sp. JXJ CY 39]
MLPPDPEDVTSTGTLSVNYENSGGPNAGEGSIRVTDNDLGTKFLINPYNPALYMQLQFRDAKRVISYALTSGNDANTRDPKNWTLAGSNDGTTWTTVDTKTDEIFASRGLTKNYAITNETAYTYYRLSITANNGSSLFQMAEWRVTAMPKQ